MASDTKSPTPPLQREAIGRLQVLAGKCCRSSLTEFQRQHADLKRICSSTGSEGDESKTSLFSREDLKPGESLYALLLPGDDLHLGSSLF